MIEKSLSGYINQKLTYLFIIVILVVLIAVFFIIEGFIDNIVYSYIYDVTVDSVFSSLNQFAENISTQDRVYDSILTDITIDFRDRLYEKNRGLENIADTEYKKILLTVLASYDSRMKDIEVDGLYDELYYYIINDDGIITKTNDKEQLNKKVNNYKELNQSLTSQVQLQKYNNEVDRYDSRKFGYIRIYNNIIIKLGFPINKNFYSDITERFIGIQDKFTFIKDIALYRGIHTPVDEAYGYPTDEDISTFLQLSDENKNISKSLGNHSVNYYTVWNSGLNKGDMNPQPYYLKLTMDFSNRISGISRTVALFISMILFLVIVSVFIINRRMAEKITTPFVELAENMNKLRAYNDLSDIDESIERTDIREVNMLLASYQEMTSELSSSFEELRAVNDELEASYKETSVLAENLNNVIHVATHLTDTVFDDKERFLVELFNVAKKLIPEADYGTVFVVDNNKFKCLDSIGHKLWDIKKINFKSDFYTAVNEVIHIKKLDEEDTVRKLSGSQLKLIEAKKPIKSSLTVKLFVGDDLAGALNYDIAKSNKASFSKQSIETIKAFGNLASAFLTMQSYKQMHERFQRQIILAIINMLEIHDSYTRGHSENVARISAMLARELGYSNEQIKNIEWAGLVHDIGKILISKKILNKEGVLTAEEYKQIKKHTIWGYEVLVSSDELKEIAVYVRHHHERWDGQGYPDGFAGEEIPRVSRIIGLADSWDTMRSDRIYRKKLSMDIAIKELKDNRGTQFDPEVVDVAMKLIEEGRLD